MNTAFDVWIQSTNTIYKGVPFGVVTDWAQQGRLAATDKLRNAGSTEAWVTASQHDLVADYLFVKVAPPSTRHVSPQAPSPQNASPEAAVAVLPTKPTEQYEPVEMDVGWGRRQEEEESDPDMIPLIDVSLVLLIFFMMTATVAVSSPVQVPQMRNAADLRADPQAFLIKIDKRPNGDIEYSLSQGTKAAEPNAVGLQTVNGVLGILDAKLAEMLARDPKKPEVHIACHEDLPADRVQDLANELEKRKQDGKIAMFGAQVTELPK
jgi:biopolymer transport protein ExbD